MKPFLATAHQEHLDNLAGYEIALEQEIEAIKADAENEDENVIYAINEYIAYNDEELALHDLAIGSGAFDKLIELRDRAIAHVAEKRIEKRMNEYHPPY
ncbi:hypothetical protein [Rodentibacter pneumotropicus]|uniref:hypothetical protein n=1 Tax=Rodentibacter pneumotropicus TaxID=758 RepID=UPI00109C1F8B|nr:hypothetical protein [Rodentibacter pneumotropicus]THA16179.1 hypothetical protein D3M82_03850 [Rodentibacter pneumotropicus]